MLTADDLDAVLDLVADTLGPSAGRDWTGVPGTGEWDAWHTAEHIGDCLLSYAAQLVARPGERYVRFLASADEDASAAEVLEFAVAGGRLLASAVRTTPPDVRAYHPTGMADPAGFAGMGCVEALLHGADIAEGLGVPFDPPRAVCERVLDRMFPAETTGLAGTDAWAALRWATGRIDLPGRARRTSWRWRGAPPDDQ